MCASTGSMEAYLHLSSDSTVWCCCDLRSTSTSRSCCGSIPGRGAETPKCCRKTDFRSFKPSLFCFSCWWYKLVFDGIAEKEKNSQHKLQLNLWVMSWQCEVYQIIFISPAVSHFWTMSTTLHLWATRKDSWSVTEARWLILYPAETED